MSLPRVGVVLLCTYQLVGIVELLVRFVGQNLRRVCLQIGLSGHVAFGLGLIQEGCG